MKRGEGRKLAPALIVLHWVETGESPEPDMDEAAEIERELDAIERELADDDS